MASLVTILGAGVAGLCVASELMSRGCEIKIIDPKGPPGPHACSWWAGGMLAPDCEGEVAESIIVRLGRQAASWWLGHGAHVTRNGSVVVALDRDKAELNRFAKRTKNHSMLDRGQLLELEPYLGDRFERALHMTDEAHIDPRQALEGLHLKIKDAGLEIQVEGTPQGHVVDCRGLYASDTLTDLRGVKGEMITVETADIDFSRPVRLLHPRFPLYIVPRSEGVFMIGATQIESSERHRASVRSVVELLNAAYALHPAFAEAEIVEIGVDARPAFPDNLPRIYQKDSRIFVNGLFRHGYLLAPAMARMTAELILDGKTPEVFYEDRS
jgi:glycine oxidase